MTQQDGGVEAHNHKPNNSNTPDGTFTCPIPGHEDSVWSRSSIASPTNWPPSLKAYTSIISSFPYPAAIFWGDDLVLLFNKPWLDAGGVDEQGVSQRGRLSPETCRALDASWKGSKPARVDGHSVLRSETDDVQFTVLVSLLFSDDTDSSSAGGVLAQLVPTPNDGASAEKPTASGGTLGPAGLDKMKDLNLSELSGVSDNVPLDQHPFFRRFAEMLPVGLAILDPRAQAIFVNRQFRHLTTHEGEDQSFTSWPQFIHPDDYERVMAAYRDAFANQARLRIEFRALGPLCPWRLLLLMPLRDENLEHVTLRECGGFICGVVDISLEKNAELTERQAAKEAHERKEQQERFIDMISHEIRNPLSAILHCTEEIEDATRDSESNQQNLNIEEVKEALSTINMCIEHQRNIVDDVLSFSKLDASMLSLRPKPCLPSIQLADNLKMFQPELRKQGIEFGYNIDSTYEEQEIHRVLADLGRIGQVLVNIVTNAIKFTTPMTGEKSITVSIGGSKKRPDSYPPNIVFFNSDDSAFRMDATNSEQWGNGEDLFIMVAVKDTGIGISEEGQRKLFERFRQATPKTEEAYGGSGLGLHISRKLCHLHGGEIGVAAKEGYGSTFGFFFKVKRTDRESNEAEDKDTQSSDEQLKGQIEDAGNRSPSKLEDNMIPQSLITLPTVNAEEINHDMICQTDERYKETTKVSEQVPGPDTLKKGSGYGESKDETAVPKQQSDSENSTHPPHVLLVEDNLINQRILKRKLESKGYVVTTANNGREAVDSIQTAPAISSGDPEAFSVILMDQEMPVMDGNSATAEIRRLERDGEVEHLPIIGLTANVRGAQQDEMISSGMDEVVGKPYKIEHLCEKLNKMIGISE